MSSEYINLRNKLSTGLPSNKVLKEEYANTSDEYKAYVSEDVFVEHFSQKNPPTTLWYDYETWGINVRLDQCSQYASLRTDEKFQAVDKPTDIYCKLSPHRLPHPVSVQVTKISPLKCMDVGYSEYEFFNLIRQEMMVNNTSQNAYNGTKFDKTVNRFAFYRNLHPAYEHEFKNGNSAWDILMVGAMSRALRPDGLNWPTKENGQPSLKLEDLCKANNITQENAHCAIDDVKALVDWGRKLYETNTELWTYLYNHKHKKQLHNLIKFSLGEAQSLKLYALTSMSLSIDYDYTSVVLPICRLTDQPDSIIVADLREDYSWVKNKTPQELHDLIYMKKVDLEAQGLKKPPFHKVTLTQNPAIVPASVVKGADAQRLNLDVKECISRAESICKDWELHQLIIKTYSIEHKHKEPTNVEEQLYGFNFFNKSDTTKLNNLHKNGIKFSLQEMHQWDDERIFPLLHNIIAKNYPEELSEKQLIEWKANCLENISTISDSNPITVDNYVEMAEEHIEDEVLRSEYITYVNNTIQSLKN